MAVTTGLVMYLFHVGLERADKLASVLSLLVAAAAFAAPYLFSRTRDRRAEPRAESIGPACTQTVTKTVVGGHLTQIRRDTSNRVARASIAADQVAPPADRFLGGQSVNGVWVGGNLNQIAGANDDVTRG
ncbi:MAG TPA: hypothetical protein VFM55_17135 [Micromonosporaceae bacterium]|nr:hypothetical protein [Micromonosporaceae bacterium]